MFDRHFLTSKLGIASLISVTVTAAFYVLAYSAGYDRPAPPAAATDMQVVLPLVVLA